MGQIKHYNNGKWTIYTSGEGLSGYTGVTDTYYVGPDLNNDGNLTKANPDGSLVNLETGIRPYKVYTALLTQSGTTAPEAIVLENTIGDINWSYINPGYYHAIISDSTYPTNKTTIISPSSSYTSNLPSGGTMDIYSVGLDSNTEVFLATAILDGVTGILYRQDDVIDPYYKAMIEIRVYN